MYLQITQPNVTFDVNKLNQFSAAPHQVHQQAIFKILHHIKWTIGQGLFYYAKYKL